MKSSQIVAQSRQVSTLRVYIGKGEIKIGKTGKGFW